MVKKRTYRLVGRIGVLFLFFLPVFVDAATLKLIPSTTTLKINQEFTVDVTIDAEEAFINAAEARITFPEDTLKLVSINRTKSAFRFWIDEPVVTEGGFVQFIGGSANGLSGDTLPLFTMHFRATGSGEARIEAGDAVIAANDGKGTNVLSEIVNATVGIGTSVVTPSAPQISEDVEVPKVVTRKATRASARPEAPELRVPLYPDADAWYSHKGEATLLWDLPSDISSVASVVDQAPTTIPNKAEEILTTGKIVGGFNEGISYAHVRFRNNIGWGETAHYRIAIDRTPPEPFEITLATESTDDPTPTISFEAHDALSGIAVIAFIVDGSEVLRATTSPQTLPPLPPGDHELSVRVFDNAGNSVEQSSVFSIDPIPTPVVGFVTSSVSVGEQVFISGTSEATGFVDVEVVSESNREVFKGSASVDTTGNWHITIEGLSRGAHRITARARDERGALSYNSEEKKFRVRSQIVFSLGFVDLGWFEIFLLLALLVFSGMGFGLWYMTKEQARKGAYGIIASRDVATFANLLDTATTALEARIFDARNTIDIQSKGEIQYQIGILHTTIQKMKKYITQTLGKL